MGKQCELEGCSKQAARGGTPHCIAHGGGKRCQEEGCTKSAIGDTEHYSSDELTVLYSNGPDDRSVKLALGYVTAATSGC
jgi:hypothetical protein